MRAETAPLMVICVTAFCGTAGIAQEPSKAKPTIVVSRDISYRGASNKMWRLDLFPRLRFGLEWNAKSLAACCIRQPEPVVSCKLFITLPTAPSQHPADEPFR